MAVYEWGFTKKEMEDLVWILKNGAPGLNLRGPTRERWRRKARKIRKGLELLGGLR